MVMDIRWHDHDLWQIKFISVNSLKKMFISVKKLRPVQNTHTREHSYVRVHARGSEKAVVHGSDPRTHVPGRPAEPTRHDRAAPVEAARTPT